MFLQVSVASVYRLHVYLFRARLYLVLVSQPVEITKFHYEFSIFKKFQILSEMIIWPEVLKKNSKHNLDFILTLNSFIIIFLFLGGKKCYPTYFCSLRPEQSPVQAGRAVPAGTGHISSHHHRDNNSSN